MTKGINIPIAADASQVIEAGKKTANALDQVIDSLDQVSDESRTTARDVDTQMTKIETSGKDAATDLEHKFSESFDTVKREAKQTSDTIGDHMKHATDEASEGTTALKENAGANFKEMGASFDGSVDSMVGSVQGFVAEATEGFGPLGLVAGAAIGAGIGALWNSIQENAENAKQIISDMYDDMIESGEDYLSKSYQQEEYWRIIKGESTVIEKKTVEQLARDTGKSFEDVALAYAGNIDKMNDLTDQLVRHRKVFEDQLKDETNTNDDAAKAGIASLNNEIALNQARMKVIDETTTAVQRQRKAWEDADRSVQGASDRIDELQQRVSDLHGGTFRIEWANRDEVLGYLRDTETLLKSITGDKSLHIARGLGGGGGQVL